MELIAHLVKLYLRFFLKIIILQQMAIFQFLSYLLKV